jgi:hypothetical protein
MFPRDMMAAAEAEPQVFISYASKDRAKVIEIANALEAAGVTIWRDQDQILGGESYGPKIVRAIRGAKCLLVCCSDAAMRSKNVKQEIQLAWRYGIPSLPVLLEQVTYHEQVEYWLTGWQYIELFNPPLDVAISKIVAGLRAAGISGAPYPLRRERHKELDVLWSTARLTDQMWPIPAEARPLRRARLRDLGAPQDEAQFAFPLGSRVQIAIECDRDTNLLLLNKGTSGKLYCLCPSQFAPHQGIQRGLNTLPQAQSPYPSFEVTGVPGREHLLAILSDESVGAQWMPLPRAKVPALVLNENDVDRLVRTLHDMPADRWIALATYFEIVAK